MAASQSLELSLKIQAAIEGLDNLGTLINDIEKLGGDATALRQQAATLSDELARLKNQQALIDQFKQLDGAAKTAADGLKQSQAQTQALAIEQKAAAAKVAELRAQLDAKMGGPMGPFPREETKAFNAELKALQTELSKAEKEESQLNAAFERSRASTKSWADAAQNARLELQKTGQAMNAAGLDSQKLEVSQARVTLGMKEAEKNTSAFRAELDNLKASTEEQATAAKAAAEVQRKQAEETKAIESALSALGNKSGEIQRLKDQLGILAKALVDGKITATEFANAEAVLNQRIDELDGTAKKAGFSFNSMREAMGAVLALTGLQQVGASLLDVAQRFDKINYTLLVSSGSAKAAIQEFQYLREVSNKLGLDLSSAASAYSKFAFATRETALEGDAAKKIFESVARAITATGGSADELSQALTALEQMISKGTVQSEELKGQLGEHLPGAFQTAAKAMGVTTKELMSLLDSGKVLASDLLPKLATELDKTFGTDRVETLTANINRLKTAWDGFKLVIADTAPIKETTNYLVASIEYWRDIGIATSGVAGKSVEELQAMHDALVRLKGTVDVGSDASENLAHRIGMVNRAMADAKQSTDAATEAETQARIAAAEHAAALEKQAKAAETASKAATDHAAALKSSYDAQRGLIEADRDAAQASNDVRTALEREGELRKLAVQEARAMVTAREAERQKAMDLVSALHAQQAATQGGDEKLREAIATAQKDLVVRQQQASAARAHAAALDKLPDSLSNVARQQALTNEQVSRYEEAARGAISQAQLIGQAFKEGKATQAEYTQATDNAQQALGTYTAAIKLHVQQLDAAAAATSRETSLNQQRYQVAQADIQARIASAKAAGDEAEAIRLGVELKKSEAAAAQQLATDKAAEAQAALAVAEAKAKEYAANGELTTAEQDATKASRDAAEAKRLEAQQSQSAADIKRGEADATARQAEAAKKATQASKDQADGYQALNGSLAQTVDAYAALQVQMAQYGQAGVDLVQRMKDQAMSFGQDMRNLDLAGKLLEDAKAQKESVDALTKSIQAAVESGQNLEWAAAKTTKAFGLLDAQHLTGLQSAIESAREKLAQQQEAIQALDEASSQAGKEYGQSLKEAAATAAAATQEAGDALTESLEAAIQKAGADAAQVARDFAAELRQIQVDSRDFDSGIDDAIRGISRDGMTDAERRADLIKELQEKTKAVQDAIRAGDLALAQQLRDRVVQIAQSLDQAISDSNGKLILSREQAAEQAKKLLEDSRRLNGEIARAREAQAEAQRQADLEAIEKRKKLEIAAAKEAHMERMANIDAAWAKERMEAARAHMERMGQLREEAAQKNLTVPALDDGKEKPTQPPKKDGLEARAKGGPVERGKQYVVTEDGPEPFIDQNGNAWMLNGDGPTVWTAPDDGRVIPNDARPEVAPVPKASTGGGDAGPKASTGAGHAGPTPLSNAPQERPASGDAGQRPMPAPAPVPVEVRVIRLDVPGGGPVRVLEQDMDNLDSLFRQLEQGRRMAGF